MELQPNLSLARGFAGHAASLWAVALSPDNSALASGDDPGTVSLRDGGTGRKSCGSLQIDRTSA